MSHFKEKLKNPRLFSLLLNLAAIGCAIFLFHPFLEENDDAFLAMIAEGAYGNRDYHLIYTNVVLGKLYVMLQTVFPTVRFHCVLQYVGIFTANYFLCELLLEKKKRRRYAVFLTLGIFYELYISLQYSKTAAFVALAACIVLCEQGIKLKGKGKISPGMLLGGTILLIYGALLRDSSFYLATMFGGLYILYQLAVNTSLDFKKMRDGIVSMLVVFSGSMLVIVCCFLVNHNTYRQDEMWNSFMEYNNARMQLLDYRYDLLDYPVYGELLSEKGISENDALLYLTWQFGDDEVLDTAFMHRLVEEMPAKKPNLQMMKAFAANLYQELFCFQPLMIALACAVILILMKIRYQSGFQRKCTAALCVFLAALSGMILCYYQYSGRWSHRIVYAMLLLVFVTVLFCTLSEEQVMGIVEKNMLLPIWLLLFVCIGALLGNTFEYQAHFRKEPDYHEFVSEMNLQKDTLYIADTFTFQTSTKYDVFRAAKQGELDNFVSVGSWFLNSPITKQITNRFGYQNPFDALKSGKQVLLLDNYYAEQKELFLEEHTGKQYDFTKTGSEFGYDHYEVRAGE